MTEREANELFYLDSAGNKQDAELHNAIINPVDFPIDEKIMGPIRAKHRAAHLAEKTAKLRAARWIKVKAKAQASLANGQNDLYRGWNEQDHPRHPAGSPQGGEFIGDGGGPEGSGKPVPGGPRAGEGSDGQPSGAYRRESPSDAQRSRDVVAIWRSDSATFYEYGKQGAEGFRNALLRSKTGEFSACVNAYDAASYKDMRLFMAPDGKSGFALNGDDIVSLFKHPDNKTKGIADKSLKLAVEQGGRKLDAFDTALPSLYARSGFKAVARLQWDESQKPDGWDKSVYKEFNGGQPDVVFMVHGSAERLSYGKNDGRRVETYDDGVAEQAKSAPSIKGYRPGVRGRGTIEVERRRDEWVAASSLKSIDDVVRAAPIAQKNFAEAGRQIAEELGITFKDPGPKTSSAKGIERTEQKIAERKGLTARVTDTARGAFVLTSPDQADAVIAKLARTHEVLAEPWRTIKDSHYTDRALLFRDRATGLIGEVQITETKMLDAKTKGGGHEMYEEARVMKNDNPRKAELNARMQALYDGVLDSYKGTDWEIVDRR